MADQQAAGLAGAVMPSVEGSGAAESRWVLSRGSCGPTRSASASRHHAYRVLRAGDLHPKQQPFRRCQEKLPGGKSLLASAPPQELLAVHAGRRCDRSRTGGERWGQAQGAAVFPQPRLPSKSNIVGTRQAPCAGSAYMGLS